jgi:peptidoglycan/xylan/chitin deacetylase (PgdA/CDA1 family)
MRILRSNGPRRKVAEVWPRLLLTAGIVLVPAGCSSGVKHNAATPAPQHPAARSHPRPRVVTPHNRPVPILNYHVIGNAPVGAPFPELYVSRGDFAQQLRWLNTHGYHAVSLRRVYDYWRRGLALPPRPIVLSFDDGYRGQFTNALPLLRRYHWPGVLNLAVQNVLDGKLTVREVRTMARDGWEIDAHSLTHPDLTTLDRAELRRQVAGSRAWIRSRVHVPADFFCYPSGRYDAAVIAAVRAAGYVGAVTTNQGFASLRDGLFTLDRIRIDASDGVGGLAARLGSGGV